jgi:5-methylcytosine-specific restriction endonuclease McrA
MNTNILVAASALSDQDLLACLERLAGREREALAELVGHLAALDSRAVLYAAQGYGSLFGYCTQALRLSEDAACNRIEAARACRRFPLILELLASGSLTLTSVRLLAPHLTAENHESVLTRARHKTRREIETLVAELAPRPDMPSTVRKVPCRSHTAALLVPAGPAPGPWPEHALGLSPGPALGLSPGYAPGPAHAPTISVPSLACVALALSHSAPSHSAPPVSPRPIVQASAPERYRVQFTIGQETHEKLRRLQALLRREISNGDPGTIFDRALTVLLEKVERTRLAAVAKPRPNRPVRTEKDPNARIRPETDPNPPIRSGTDPSLPIRPAADTDLRRPGHSSRTVPPAMPSRHVPRAVKREVWRRDAGQCAFVSTTGRRCAESTFLEFHHVQPYAKQGPATVANISLRCWRHNHYEAELIFGPYGPSMVREARQSLVLARSGPSRTIDS